MPIKVPYGLPVKDILEGENISVMDDNRAMHQDIRPIQILILNLMPMKEDTELQILRELSNTPLQIDCIFMRMQSHVSKNASKSHLDTFYVTFDEIRRKYYDGMIVTGAPVELLEFEEVDYWEELEQIFSWANTHVTSTMFLCWGAQAGYTGTRFTTARCRWYGALTTASSCPSRATPRCGPAILRQKARLRCSPNPRRRASALRWRKMAARFL